MAGTIAVTSPALALDGSSVFNHDYADPNHPFCEAKIVVNKGLTFHYTGTRPATDDAAVRACSREEIQQYTLRKVEFDGQLLADNRISIGADQGLWEPKNTATTTLGFEDVDGIRWNNGNKWIVKSQSYVSQDENGKNVVVKKPMTVVVGEWIFLSYIGFSTLAGVRGFVDGVMKKRQHQA